MRPGAIESAMSEQMVSALERKRLELSRRVKADTVSIQAIDRVLALYAAPGPAAIRSGVTRAIIALIREAPEPPTVREIAAKLAQAKGVPGEVHRFISRTEKVLYKLRLRRLVESVDISGRAKGWRVANAVSGDLPES